MGRGETAGGRAGTAGEPTGRVGRRTLLRAAAGAGALAVAAAGTGVAMAEDVLPGGARLRRALGLTGPDGVLPAATAGPVRTEDRRSTARGTTVRLITMTPPGDHSPADLPVCLALHGRGATARTMVETGLPEFLSAAVAAGVPPFAVVAVDGGNASYWRRTATGDDPQRMLLDELPGWLAEQGLRPPGGAMGISMGGFGALNYARNRGKGFGPVAALSPAVFRSWPDAEAVEVFRDEADWREYEPLLHLDQPLGGPLGVWCGTEDPFCDAARRLAPHAAQAHFSPGEHSGGFWRRVLPDVMPFLGHALAGRPA